MADYQELYLKMFRASTQAIEVLTAVQKECEELYITSQEPELVVLPHLPEAPPHKTEQAATE